jgi:dTDP-4-amino-4,6-dideoxygalactose transaminase
MDAIMSIADKHGLFVIEDAAQCILSNYQGRPLGGIGHLAALSFHETKNVICGEGGALLINDERFVARAEIIREKGTNRSKFFRGQVDKYTWVDIGSSWLPGELNAAFLAAQLEHADEITARRLEIWQRYYDWSAGLEAIGAVRRPIVPPHCGHNAHMFYLLLPNLERRTAFIAQLRNSGILAVFHYIPLHSAPAGRRFGRSDGELPVTDDVGDRLVRLPLWLPDMDQQRVESAAAAALA